MPRRREPSSASVWGMAIAFLAVFWSAFFILIQLIRGVWL